MKGPQSGGILASVFKLKHAFNSFEEIWEIVFVDYQMKTSFMKCTHFSCLQLGFFFLKLEKKSPRFDRERGRISAPEDTKKNPWNVAKFCSAFHEILAFGKIGHVNRK